MSQSSGTIVSIYKSRKNVLELLEERGYDVEDYSHFSINEVHTMYESQTLDMLLTNEQDNKKVYVKYHMGENIKDKTLRDKAINEYIEDLFHLDTVLEPQTDTLLIITKIEPNSTMIKLLEQIWKKEGIFLVILNIKRLQFNIMKHDLVPKHRVLTNEENTAFRKKYNVMNDEQIPTISRFDPVSLALCLRPGEICEITRPSRTSVTSTFYRVCI
jgi:DNA-directed RNA polymerase subunit H (RpoH/RPB5)